MSFEFRAQLRPQLGLKQLVHSGAAQFPTLSQASPKLMLCVPEATHQQMKDKMAQRRNRSDLKSADGPDPDILDMEDTKSEKSEKSEVQQVGDIGDVADSKESHHGDSPETAMEARASEAGWRIRVCK